MHKHIMDNNKKFSFSVYTYFLLTALSVLIFFGAFAFIVKDKGSSLKQNMIEVNRATLKQDLHIALKQIQKELEEIKQPLIEWDEVRQQLNNPQYYAYWYQNRLINSSILPEFIDNIELFDRDRQLLAGNPSANEDRKFTAEMLGMLAYLRDSQIIIGYGFPITGNRGTETHGFGYIEVELMRAIRFQYILNSQHVEKITHNFSEKEVIPFDKLINRLEIPLKETPESLELSKLIDSVQNNLILIGTLLSIVIWLLIVYLFARPLTGLSSLIDRLRNDSNIHSGHYTSEFLSVTEIEKTRRSLTQFHDQLQLRNNELINSEKQLRTILDNVPDGVISIVDNDLIFSCNPAAGRLFSRSTKEMIGMHLSELVVPCENDELQGIRSDATTFPAEMTFSKTISESATRIVIVRDISKQKDAEAKLIQLANFDSLTNLPNRALMRDRLDHAIQIARCNQTRIALMFLDLDRFKTFNDTLGHQLGDTLLIEIAARLLKTVRQSDTVARLGGDEFTVILENIHSNDELTEIAENILQAIRQPMQLGGRDINVTTSIGITIYPTDDNNPENLLKNADTAMYRAKELGGDNYQYFTEDMNVKAMRHLELEDKLRHALPNEEFRLFFQPRVNMDTQRIMGAEVLLRWQRSPGEIILPGTFISNAEDTGLIIPLGNWILEQTCKQIRIWQEAGISVPRLSVNISPRQFNESGFLEMVGDILKRTGVSPHLLEFEITEGMIMDSTDKVIATLQRLRHLGISISLDDFGTGYSSLSYLKRLPIDVIKIDRSFVSDIPSSEDACSIVNAIIALSIGLKRNVIAEGIETSAQAAYLLAVGCHECQGNLYHQPMPVTEFARLIQRHSPAAQNHPPTDIRSLKG